MYKYNIQLQRNVTLRTSIRDSLPTLSTVNGRVNLLVIFGSWKVSQNMIHYRGVSVELPKSKDNKWKTYSSNTIF